MRRRLLLLPFFAASLHAVHPAAETLLAPVDLPGAQTTVRWNELSSLNSSGAPSSGSGTIMVNSPGFRGSAGYYSFSGHYGLTTGTTTLPAGDVQTVVLQIVGMRVADEDVALDYSIEDHLAFGGGPVLTYTHAGGSGTLAPVGSGTRGTPISGAGGGFEGDYHDFVWQWDLRGLDPALVITGLSITAPLVMHSSTIGVQLDAGDTFAPIIGAPALTALEQWRQLHFGSPANSGDGADANDFDHDGLPNLLEYALGREPKVTDSAPATTIALNPSGTHLVLGFNRIADPALSYLVEAKDDLSAAVWTDITPASPATAPAGPVAVEDTQALAASPRRFLRLRVETATP